MRKINITFLLLILAMIFSPEAQPGQAASPRGISRPPAQESQQTEQGTAATPDQAVTGTAEQGSPTREEPSPSETPAPEPVNLDAVNQAPIPSPRLRGRGAVGNNGNPPGGKAIGEQRRSMVANTIQEMYKLAERNQGIGHQIRTIAQNQNSRYEKTEKSLERIKNRNRLMKFFFGENWSHIFKAEKSIQGLEGDLAKLRELSGQITDPSESDSLANYIASLESAKDQLKAEVGEKKKLGGIFGLLNKWIAGVIN